MQSKFPQNYFGGSWILLKCESKILPKRRCDSNISAKKASAFVALTNIELERLEEPGIIEKTDYSPRRSPTVYIKKKRVCADYSTGLLETNYPLPSTE